MTTRTSTSKQRSVNMSVSKDVMEAAKALGLDVSRAAEAGVIAAIKQAREQVWRRENKAAIEAHNARVEKSGILLTPDWTLAACRTRD